MSKKSRQRTIATIKLLMSRPAWWNEAFAKYDQKRLHAWAKEQHAKALEPLQPKFEVPETSFSDRLIYGELYRPYVARSNQRFVI